ncbi:MAG: hypothetical protein K1X94_27000 [Sandaracinaceae bacterium]|nr:hypothetical protein [Sandaracinaceae bacterium]
MRLRPSVLLSTRAMRLPTREMLLVAILLPACSEPVGDERLARQAALGQTIEYQAIRFADRVLTETIDCTATPEENAAAIAARVGGDLGACGDVMQTGAGVDVMTGASCDFGHDTIASLASHLDITREADELVFAFDMPRARINGLDAVGTMTLRTSDCGTFHTTMALESNEYTIATPAGDALEVQMSTTATSIGGLLDVHALHAAAGMQDLTVHNDTLGFEIGDCWPRSGAIRGMRDSAMITITFDATSVASGNGRVTPAVGGTTVYELPMYGPCPDQIP